MAKQPAGGTSDSRRGAKSAAAFRTISEVAAELDLPQHVLRFWETKFKVIKPMKRGGGRRYYRPEDVALLRNIRDLLYTDGYTIKGVQKLLRKGGGKPAAAESSAQAEQAAPPAPGTAEDGGRDPGFRAGLEDVVAELENIRSMLRGAGP
ncbi:MAG: MerR family transcriptional regulator [Proteobacteria bacterium]|nr:MerR family transcriptional regulator [Pseudomonadota bacterium]